MSQAKSGWQYIFHISALLLKNKQLRRLSSHPFPALKRRGLRLTAFRGHPYTSVKAVRPRVAVRRKTKALAACTRTKTRRCLLTKFAQRREPPQRNFALRVTVGQALCCLVVVLLWWINWKLFLATTVGIGLMSSCYLLQNSHWQRYWQKWRSFVVGSNRQLVLAVGAGSSGAFCTYLAASVWADAENQWLATGSILQGLVSLTTLGLLLWSLRGKKAGSLEAKLDLLLRDLSHSDSLKRLIAIRQLTRLLISNRLSAAHYSQTVEYFHLMLSEPQPQIIRNALLESLNLLDTEPATRKPAPVKIPLKLKSSRKTMLNKALID